MAPSAPAICPRGWRSASTACSAQDRRGRDGRRSTPAVQPVIGKRVAIKVLARTSPPTRSWCAGSSTRRAPSTRSATPTSSTSSRSAGCPTSATTSRWSSSTARAWPIGSKRGPFQPDEARRLLRQICQALEAAHRQGIVHRDLKPDNIWIVQPQHGDSYAKLLDFGIAKLMGDADEGQRTQTGIVMGTPAYMSPEQCRGVNVEQRHGHLRARDDPVRDVRGQAAVPGQLRRADHAPPDDRARAAVAPPAACRARWSS